MATKAKVGKVECLETVCITLGAKPPVFQKAIVRDRHTGQLAEVELNEYPPIDEGDIGTSYTFKRGEIIRADHPAVVAKGSRYFDPVDD